MNDPRAAIALGRRIDLTREPELAVGGVVIQPTACEVTASGRSVRLQPRVMEVLVALARAGGQPVSRETLLSVSWGDVTVGEDALNRCIQRLRRLSETEANGAFVIETIPRLGYRMTTQPTADSTPSDPDCSRETTLAIVRARLLAPAPLAGLLLLVVVGAVAWSLRDHAPWVRRPLGGRIAVLPLEMLNPNGVGRGFSEGLVDAIVDELADSQVQAVPGTEAQAKRGADAGIDNGLGADLLLRGTVKGNGKTIHVTARLDDTRDRATIWSDTFEGPADAPDALRASVAARTADVAHWAVIGRVGRVRLDSASLAALIAGRDSITGVRHGNAVSTIADYRRVVAAAPDFSWGHSGIAVAEAFTMLRDPAPVAVGAIRDDIRREARRALELDPHNGEAYLALELSLPTLAWRERDALISQALVADPAFEPTALMEGRLLWDLGRNRDALTWLESAHDLDHLHNGTTWSLALSLAAQGRRADSDALVRTMLTQWPGHAATRDARFWGSLVAGRTNVTLTLLADPAARPADMDQNAVDAWRAVIEANGGRDPLAKARASERVTAAADSRSLSRGQAMTLQAMLGDLDEAFAQARLYQPADPSTPPYLFLPFTRPMRADIRFMPLARRLGFVSYWRGTGRWPDFCGEPGLHYDCRAAADGAKS